MKRSENEPGLQRIAYRLGEHGDFMEAMRERLPTLQLPDGDAEGRRPLASLTTRSASDPSIALLDAFAVVADVLTFYQERIANEGFLRTATERRSVLELASAIGYTLDPGVAATVNLAFTLDAAPNTPRRVSLEPGLQVQSIPGPGELPQLFETVEALVARPEWNVLRPRLKRPQPIGIGTDHLWLDGVGLRLKVGDALLVVGDERATGVSGGDERWDFRIAHRVEPDREHGVTRVTLDRGLGWRRFRYSVAPAEEGRRFYVFRGLTSLFGHNAAKWETLPDATKALFLPRVVWDPERPPTITEAQYPGWEPEELELAAKPPYLDLVGKLKDVTEGSWVVLISGGYAEVVRVDDLSMGTRSDFLVTGPYTRVVVDPAAENLDKMDRRKTVVYVDSDELPAGEQPIVEPVGGNRVELDGIVEGLFEGQKLLFVGTTVGGGVARELAVLDAVELSPDGLSTLLILDNALRHEFDRLGVEILGNVVAASHGESSGEQVLGSGDAAKTHQRFALRKPPLTHATAATPGGSEPALEVRVDGVRWDRLPTLHAQGPEARGYVVHIDDDGVSTVIFGDGRSGARLPTGAENVVAIYRSGLGAAGNVGADSLRVLKTKPLGVKAVDNPIAAKGGTDPESLADARANAPLTVLTLDRLVSITDFTDFVRGFAGIAKAQAAEIWSGERRIVHVTVAAEGGGALHPGDELYEGLLDAIHAHKDPTQLVRVGTYVPRPLRIAAEVLVDERYVAEDVLAAVEFALRDAYQFERRAIGQPATAADVVRVVHTVDGVAAIDLNALYRVDGAVPPPDASEAELASYLAPVLVAARAALQPDGSFSGAELLWIDAADPAAVVLSEMSA